MFRPLRMLLSPLLVALVLSSTATAAPTCKRLTDGDSPFVSTLSILISVQGAVSNAAGGSPPPPLDPHVFAPIDKSLPNVSQCVAQINPLEVVSALMSPDAMKCSQYFSDLDTSNMSGSPTMFQDKVCPAVKEVEWCLTSVLMPVLDSIMANTHGCCDALNDEVSGAFGASTIHEAISSMINVVGNALCTERDGTEACGDSLVNNWLPQGGISSEKDMARVLDGFQIPNSEICKAVASEEFSTTVSTRQQFGSTDLKPYGACYAPMDSLVEYARNLPLWKSLGSETEEVVSEAFGDVGCLAGKSLVQWAMNDNGPVMKSARVVDDVMGVVASLFGGPGNDQGSEQPPSPPYSPSWSPSPTPADASNSGEGDGGDYSSNSGSGGDATSDVYDGPSSGDDHAPPSSEGAFVQVAHIYIGALNAFATDMCIHFPNGVTCDFPGEVLDWPYDNSTSHN